jgi:cytochrome c oxidase subunit III
VSAATTRGVPAPLLGMLLFVSSELMFFGALFGAYFTLRARTATWPPAGTPELDAGLAAFFTLFLVASSATQHAAVTAARRGDRRATARLLAATIALGSLFLAGQGYEYASLAEDGFRVGSNVFATLFFTMTGFHGLHVFGGLCALLLVLANARRGDLPAADHGPIEAVSVYWHFVDVVWLFLFSLLYLLP